MIFDRIALSDVPCNLPNSPELLAQNIRHQFKLGFEPAPLDEISSAVGIWNVEEFDFIGIEGVVIFDETKYEGLIGLKKNQNPYRKRFTWAHELGHFVHQNHEAKGGFNCDNADVFGFGQDVLEKEANRFASELLLPQDHLNEFLSNLKNHDFSKIIELSDRMQISKSASIRKIADTCNYPVAFIFSQHEKMRYFNSRKFPRLRRISKMPLPDNCLARTFAGADNTCSPSVEVKSNDWLVNNSSMRLIEQVFIQENGYKITMLRLM